MIRVFLLDDHALVRTGFRLILSNETDIEIVGEAATGEEALPLIRQVQPDLVLCDLHLPGMSGLEVTQRLARSRPAPRVIVVTVQEDGPLPRRVLEAGAAGYLGKACPANELLCAVRMVALGKRYVGSDIAQRLALGALEAESTPFDVLSPRELEISLLLCRGQKMQDIAERLHLSPKTIATHKYRALDKLEVRDTLALSRMAAQYGLLEAP